MRGCARWSLSSHSFLFFSQHLFRLLFPFFICSLSVSMYIMCWFITWSYYGNELLSVRNDFGKTITSIIIKNLFKSHLHAKTNIYDFSRIRSHEKFFLVSFTSTTDIMKITKMICCDLLYFALLMCSYLLATGVCMIFVCLPDFCGQIRVYKEKDGIKVKQFCR